MLRARFVWIAATTLALLPALRANAQTDAGAPDAGPAQAAPVASPTLTAPVLIEQAPAELPPGHTPAVDAAALLELLVSETGAVTEAKVLEAPDAELGAAAINAMTRSRFEPARRDGQAIAARIRYRFAFVVPSAAPPAVVAPVPAAVAPTTTPAAAPPPVPPPQTPPPPERAESPDGLGATASTEAPVREVTRRPLKVERIGQIAGANNDPLRAIEVLPGVARPPLNETLVLIRGAGPEDSVVMVEGTPVLLLYHLGGFKSFYNPALLERVDFYPGNFSVRYGRAIGGAIDARVRDPRRDGFHGMAEVSLLDASLMLEGPVTEDLALAVAGRRSYVDALLAAFPQEDNTIVAAPVYWDYQALASYRVGPSDELYLQGFGSSDSLALVFEEPPDELPELRGSLEAETQFHRALVGWKHRYGGGVAHDIKLGIGYLMLDARIGQLLTQRVRSPDFYGRSEWHVPLASWLTLDAGLDFAGFSGDLEYDGPEFRQNEVDPASDSVDVQLRRHVDLLRPAGYVELNLRPVERLALIPGVRIDYFGEIDAVSLDPRFSARYGITEATVIKAGIGQFSQPPPLGSAVPDLGNENLDPSHALHLSAGAEQKIGPELSVDVEGYVKWLSDLVVNTPDGSEPRLTNDGKGRIYGLEIALNLEMDELFGALSYSLSRSERQTPEHGYVLFDYDQPHILAAMGGYKLGRGWQISSTFRLVSGNPETPVLGALYQAGDDSYFPLYGRPNSTRAELFHRLDLRIEKRWRIRTGAITLFLDIQNVYNATHAEATVYGFDYRQQDDIVGLPILPIIGVRGEL